MRETPTSFRTPFVFREQTIHTTHPLTCDIRSATGDRRHPKPSLSPQPNPTQPNATPGCLSAFAPILCTGTAKFMQVCIACLRGCGCSTTPQNPPSSMIRL